MAEQPPRRIAEQSTLVIPRPDLGTVVVAGPDRTEWLQGLVTCDVAALSGGAGAWGLQLKKTGKIVTDLVVVSAADRLFLSTAAGRAEPLLSFLTGYLIMEDAEIENGTAEHAWIWLHGPGSRDVVEQWPDGAIAAASVDWTGLGGAAVVVPTARLDATVEAIAGGGPDRCLGSLDDWNALRVERFVPQFGVDFDSSHTPHDASLERRAVSWSKGCYLGQEVVCTQDMRGKVRRRLVLIESAEPPSVGATVADAQGAEIGSVTSVSPAGERALALARVRVKCADPGVQLLVDGAPARVVEPRR